MSKTAKSVGGLAVEDMKWWMSQLFESIAEEDPSNTLQKKPRRWLSPEFFPTKRRVWEKWQEYQAQIIDAAGLDPKDQAIKGPTERTFYR